MKFLAFLVSLLVVNLCSSENRTTLWMMADEQITSAKLGYQVCSRVSSPYTLLKTNYIEITGTEVAIFEDTNTGEINTGASTSIYAMGAVTIKFTYDTDNTKTYTFPAFSGVTAASAVTVLTTALNPNVEDSIVLTQRGEPWLSIDYISSYSSTNSFTITANNKAIIWSQIVITDSKSNSTIGLLAWEDGADATATTVTDFYYNQLYSVVVRVPYDQLSTSSGTLASGCTSRTTKKKRSVVRNRRALTDCTLSTVSDSSFANLATTICNNADEGDFFGNLVSVTGNLADTVKSVDTAYFGAAGSKFTIAANFGVLITMSSIIFSFLN